MLDTVLEIAMSAVLACACLVIISDLLRDVVINVKKTIDEVKGKKQYGWHTISTGLSCLYWLACSYLLEKYEWIQRLV